MTKRDQLLKYLGMLIALLLTLAILGTFELLGPLSDALAMTFMTLAILAAIMVFALAISEFYTIAKKHINKWLEVLADD